MSGFGEGRAPATANQALTVDDLEPLRVAGRRANAELCESLDAVFVPQAAFFLPERVTDALSPYVETVTHQAEDAEAAAATGTEVHTSLRINDGSTALLTYGLGSRSSVLVQRDQERGHDGYALLFIDGDKEDPGFAADHSLVKYEVHSETDLVRTLDIESALALRRERGSGEVPVELGEFVQRGSLSYETLYGLSLAAGNPALARELLEGGIALGNEAREMIASIGSPRTAHESRAWPVALRRGLAAVARLATGASFRGE